MRRVAALVASICLALSALPAPAVVESGKPAPLDTPIIVQTLEGKEVPLAEQVSGATMLVFWAGWCGPCIKEIPELNELHAFYGPKGLKVIGLGVLSGDETLDQVKTAAGKHGITYTVLYDGQGAAAKAFDVSGLPAAFLIDGSGTIQWRGAQLARNINDRIKRVLAPAGERGEK